MCLCKNDYYGYKCEKSLRENVKISLIENLFKNIFRILW